MAGFADLINHPNFGRLYRESPGFADSFITRYLPQTPVGEAMTKMKLRFKDMGLDEAGEKLPPEMVIDLLDDARQVIRLPNESNSAYFERAREMAQDPFSRVRTYGGKTPYSTQTGSAINRRLDILANQHNVDFKVHSLPTQGDATRAILEEKFGKNAYIKTDPDVITVLTAVSRKDNQELSLPEITKMLGYGPSADVAPKRLGAILNEAELELTFDLKNAADSVKVGVFTPEQMLNVDEAAPGRIKSFAENLHKTQLEMKAAGENIRVQSVDEIIKGVYETATDGTGVITQSGVKRTVDQINAQIADLNAEKAAGRINPNLADRRIAAFQDKIRELKDAVVQGRSYNTRILNGEDVIKGGSRIDAKAELTVVDTETFRKMGRRLGLSDDQIKMMDTLITTSSVDKKMGKQGFDRTISAMTMNAQPLVDLSPRSNSLTSAVFGDFLDPNNFLRTSLEAEIQDALAAIKTGKSTPGLKRLIDQMQAAPISDLSPAEAIQAERSRAFASKIKNFFDSGGDLRTDPEMTRQLISQIRDHHFSLSKKAKRAIRLGKSEGQTYLYKGATVDALDVRFPMPATLSHLRSSAFFGEEDQMFGRSGMARGGHSIGAVESYIHHAAMGGFDFDDTFYKMYQYDTKTNRLLKYTLRDPNAMGEFIYEDADVIGDKLFNGGITLKDGRLIDVQELERERRMLIGQMTDSYDPGLKVDGSSLSNKKIKGILGRVNKINEDLRAAYTSDSRIASIDLQQMFGGRMPSPVGYTRSAESTQLYANSLTSSYRHLGQSRKTAEQFISEKIRSDARVNYSSMFEFVGNVTQQTDTEGLPVRVGGKPRGKIKYKAYNEYHQRYFKVISPKDAPGAGRVSARKLYTSDELMRIVDDNTRSGGVLGRAVNQYTVIDNFISRHLDFANEGIDPKIANELERLLDVHKLVIADREALIDSIVKQFDAEFVADIEKALPGNARKLGLIIKELNAFVESEGLAYPNGDAYRAGLDPILWQERFKSDKSASAAILDIFDGDEAGLLLSETDQKADFARLLGAKQDVREWLDEESVRYVQEAADDLSEVIGDGYTPAQMKYAQGIVEDFTQSSKIARQNADVVRYLDALDALDGSGFDDFTAEAIQRRTLAKLEGRSSDDVLAVARLLLDSGGNMGVMGQAIPMEDLGGANPNEIFQRAFNQKRISWEIGQARSLEEMENVFKFIPGKDVPDAIEFTDIGKHVFSPRERNQAIQRHIDELIDYAEKMPAPDAEWEIRRTGELEELKRVHIALRADSSWDDPVRELKFGGLNTAMRSEADEAAETTVKAGGDFVTRLRQFRLSDLTNGTREAKYLRRGMVAIGAFAGVGIVHRLVTGDRTIDEANPYPLIPQGSKYEKIANAMDFQQAPVVSGGSMSYKIKAHGVSDVSALESAVQGVLGQGNTTIYNSRAYDMGYGGSNSRSILDERLGR